MKTCLVFVHALSPLHAGTGQGVGVIDLPIARERATALPFLPGSSLKGSLRDRCPEKQRTAVFGPESTNASESAGSAVFSDARLLLLPVRALNGTFAWVTSPLILKRLVRDVQDAHYQPAAPSAPVVPSDAQCIVAEQGAEIEGRTEPRMVYLEDLDLRSVRDSIATRWAQWLGPQLFPDDHEWQRMLTGRLCIVHDDVMRFLLETSTEVTARIKLKDDTKTVQKGGLWYEEALPAESVLAGLVMASPVKAANMDDDAVLQVLETITKDVIQLGGKATVGRGLCRVRLHGRGR